MTKASEQAFATKVLFAVFGVAMTGLTAWMWQIDRDRHQQTELATQMENVIADLTSVVQKLDQVGLNTQSIDSLTRIVENLAEWQQEWPRTGLLQADVQQNADIGYLKEQNRALAARLASLERAVASYTDPRAER